MKQKENDMLNNINQFEKLRKDLDGELKTQRNEKMAFRENTKTGTSFFWLQNSAGAFSVCFLHFVSFIYFHFL